MSPAALAALFAVLLVAVIIAFLVLSIYNAVIALRLRQGMGQHRCRPQAAP